MVDTIESFVSKLQQQGVQTGREAAQKLQDEAENKVQQIITDAETKAQQIVADAQKQGESILSRSQSELNLAARDISAKLRDTLSSALNELLAKAANVTLSDTNVLGTILHDIVKMYVDADIKGEELVKILANHNKPLRLGTIAMSMGTLPKNLSQTIEPYLFRAGLITKDDKGRIITPKGYRHIKNNPI